MIQKTVWIRLYVVVFSVLLTAVSCKTTQMSLPSYEDFTTARQKVIQPGIHEIYGRYSATLAKKTVRSQFNLLLLPGLRAYLEILNPARQLVYAVAIDSQEIILSYVQENRFIREASSVQTLLAITGFPLYPDDLLLLMGGYGLNFPRWQAKQIRKDGWLLERAPFQARVSMKEEIVKIEVSAPNQPSLKIQYDHYRTNDTYSLPSTIRFELPDRKMKVEWDVEKLLPRDEAASDTLFAVELKPGAKQWKLKEIYKGKPLLME